MIFLVLLRSMTKGKTSNRMKEGRRGSSRINMEEELSRRSCRTVKVASMVRNRMGRVGRARRNVLVGRTHRLGN